MKDITRQIRNELSDCYTANEITAITRILATELLGFKEYIFFLKEDVTPTKEQQELLKRALNELKKHKPIQHILGYEQFCGLKFKVNDSVLIPRPETSELVSWIIDNCNGNERILDIGTGSGCIAISLAHKMPKSRITAWDISTKALEVAIENSKTNNVNIHFEQCDILNYKPGEKKFEIIVSNPPYIKECEKAQMESNVLDWEPSIALFVPDNNPLLFYRTIAEKALDILTPGGFLFFEINRAHGTDVCNMLAELGYRDIEMRKDFADNDRMVKAIL